MLKLHLAAVTAAAAAVAVVVVLCTFAVEGPLRVGYTSRHPAGSSAAVLVRNRAARVRGVAARRPHAVGALRPANTAPSVAAGGLPACTDWAADAEACKPHDSKVKCASNGTAAGDSQALATRRVCPRMCGLCLEDLDDTVFCPDPLYPVLERHDSPNHGDVCRSSTDHNVWDCPRYCKEVAQQRRGRTKAPYCHGMRKVHSSKE